MTASKNQVVKGNFSGNKRYAIEILSNLCSNHVELFICKWKFSKTRRRKKRKQLAQRLNLLPEYQKDVGLVKAASKAKVEKDVLRNAGARAVNDLRIVPKLGRPTLVSSELDAEIIKKLDS